MRALVITAVLAVSTPVLAYTDSRGYHPPGECDIWTTTCKSDYENRVGITAYGTRREYVLEETPSGSGAARDAYRHCNDNPYIRDSAVLMEQCIKSEEEAEQRLQERR